MINSIANKFSDKIISLREHIHMHPELGFEEHNTSELVCRTLRCLGIDTTPNVAKTGVVGVLEGKQSGKTILLRADMDALPINEQADVPYKSVVPSVMHACGHDGHTAALLGAAMILNECRDVLNGTVKFMFQPAEETLGGALPMIECGVLDGVDIAVAGHMWGSLPHGEVHIRPGCIMASPIIFTIKVLGKGGHGGMPQFAKSPIIVASQIISSLQCVVSGMTNPIEPAVLSIGQIHSGSCFNVIPNDAFIEGTVRVFDLDSANRIKLQMEQIISGVCAAYGVDYQFDFKVIYPPVINDPVATQLVKDAASKVTSGVHMLEEPSMGGEDFSYVGMRVPSAFFMLGVAQHEPVIHHNPYFCWDSSLTVTLAKCLAQVAVEYLK